MQPYLHSNPPPWAVKTLKIFWSSLKRQANTLPGRLRGAMPVAYDAEEFGCGFFGCVFPTNKRNITFKLTKDRNEARFVKWLLKHPQAGILKHYKIVQLDVGQETLNQQILSHPDFQKTMCQCQACVGYPIRNGPIWAIWREECQPGYSHEKFVKSKMPLVYQASRAVFWLNRDNKITPQVRVKAAQVVSYYKKHKKLKRSPPAIEALAQVEIALNLVMKNKDLRNIAKTILNIYKKHNILVTDIHANNIGKTKHGWVISDPGEVAWLPKAKKKIRRARR